MKLFEDPPPAISHSAHTAHELKLVTTDGAPFRCDGCMQPGDAHRYRCEPCNFDLHTCCALPTATVEHALFKGCTFTFHHKPPGPRRCDACGDAVTGFVYHCGERDLDLHPSCALLPERFVKDGHVFELRKEASHRCGLCGDKGERRRFWAYRYCCYDPGEVLYLHVACLKDAHRARNIGSGGHIMLAGAPMMEGLLQSLPRRTRRSRGFEHFRKIVGVVVSVIIAVIFGNPMALLTAVAGPGGLLRG